MEQPELLTTTEVIHGCAIFLGQHINIKQLRHFKHLASKPLTIEIETQGIVILFRYGVVVFYGLQSDQIYKFISEIRSSITELFDSPEKEDFELFLDMNLPEGIKDDRICVHSYDVQRIQAVADVLAKSTVLAHYEKNLTQHFDRIEPLALSLRQGHHGGPKGRDLLKHIGDTLMIEAKMTGRIEVTEKPQLIWDYPEQSLFLNGVFDLFQAPL